MMEIPPIRTRRLKGRIRKRLSLRRREIKKGSACGGTGFWPLAQSEAMSAFGGKADGTGTSPSNDYQRGVSTGTRELNRSEVSWYLCGFSLAKHYWVKCVFS